MKTRAGTKHKVSTDNPQPEQSGGKKKRGSVCEVPEENKDGEREVDTYDKEFERDQESRKEVKQQDSPKRRCSQRLNKVSEENKDGEQEDDTYDKEPETSERDDESREEVKQQESTKRRCSQRLNKVSEENKDGEQGDDTYDKEPETSERDDESRIEVKQQDSPKRRCSQRLNKVSEENKDGEQEDDIYDKEPETSERDTTVREPERDDESRIEVKKQDSPKRRCSQRLNKVSEENKDGEQEDDTTSKEPERDVKQLDSTKRRCSQRLNKKEQEIQQEDDINKNERAQIGKKITKNEKCGQMEPGCKKTKSNPENVGVEKKGGKAASLIDAVQNDDMSSITHVLSDLTPEVESSQLESAFLLAVARGKKFIVQLLLHSGFKLSKDIGGSALLSASRHGYSDIVTLLLKTENVSVDYQDQVTGKTALMLTIEKSCSSSLVKEIIESGADLNIQDAEGQTALMIAVQVCDFASVKLLGQSVKCDIYLKDKNGKQAHHLAKGGIAGQLAEVLLKSKLTGYHPLYLAAWENNAYLAKLLQQLHLCNPIHHTDQTVTPLLAAIIGRKNYERCINSDKSFLAWDGTIMCSVEMVKALLNSSDGIDRLHPKYEINALMMAACAGSQDLVKILLEYGADVNSLSAECVSPVMFAASYGFKNIVDILCGAGAYLTLTDKYGNCVLKHAVVSGDIDCIAFLLDRWPQLNKSHIDFFNRNTRTILAMDAFLQVRDRWKDFDSDVLSYLFFESVGSGRFRLVCALIEHGVDVNLLYEGELPLMRAIDKRDLEMMVMLLVRGANVNGVDGLHDTPLTSAVRSGFVAGVSKLLEFKADMNGRTSTGNTAICIACERFKKDVIQVLLNAGADINSTNKYQESPLSCLLSNYYNRGNDSTAVEFLIQNGANINTAGSFHNVTPLMRALGCCSPEIASLLIENGADVNMEDLSGDTAMLYALRRSLNNDSPDLRAKVSLLLKHGANINHANKKKETAIIFAAKLRPLKTFDLLVEKGACVTDQDEQGNSVLHYLVSSISPEESIVQKMVTLVTKGADMNTFNNNDETPLVFAIARRGEKIVKTLLTLGAEVNFFNNLKRRTSYVQRLHLSIIGRNLHPPYASSFKKLTRCLVPILERGCYLGPSSHSFLSGLFVSSIKNDDRKMVRLLVQSGFEPTLLKRIDIFGHKVIAKSAVHVAMIMDRLYIVSFLSEACFFNEGDFKELCWNYDLQRRLKLWGDKCPSGLSPKTWTLQTRCLLAVSSAIGFGPDRCTKVRSLLIPTCVQDHLLYKNIQMPGERNDSAPLTPNSQ